MKTIKKEFDNTVVTAQVMPQLKRDLLGFKMLKVITPAMGAVQEAEFDLGLMLGIICHHASNELFNELTESLYSLLLTDKLEPVEDIEEWLELKGLHSLDVLMWLFKETFNPLMASVEVSKLKNLLQDTPIASMFKGA
ncbi:hypothetical protein Q5V23_004423 [Vibrio fluvialis]|nr:hypothetical protein [Vibrio fluvialis]ELL4670529.1 hypothetical protein [Vibrio fluvialis]